MKLSWLYVFLGGGLGSLCRFYLSSWLDAKSDSPFPWGTFASNMLASLIFGLIAGYMVKHEMGEQYSLFLLGGFCGGFSTFSTFSKDNFYLLENGDYFMLAANISISIILGIAFFFLGVKILTLC